MIPAYLLNKSALVARTHSKNLMTASYRLAIAANEFIGLPPGEAIAAVAFILGRRAKAIAGYFTHTAAEKKLG